MPPPNTIYNEYIYENFRVLLPSGRVKVCYEPFENFPVLDLEGLIFCNLTIPKISQKFQNYNNSIHSVENNFIDNIPKMMRGVLTNQQSTLILIWDVDPIEHFLCVSYCFGKNCLSFESSIIWHKEGF